VAPLLSGSGVRILEETRSGFEEAKASYWNVITLPGDALADGDHPLAAHFVSRLLPFGHVKSSAGGDDAFLEVFEASEKWLRCTSDA